MHPTHDPKTIALEVRSSRKAQGLTQSEVAERAGLGVRTVRNLEAGKPVQPGTLGLVLRALGVEPTVPQFPDDVAFIVNAIGLRLMAVDPKRRADLAGRLTSLLVEDAGRSE
jgi:transcriptional regulator with XRE-family HTH domain